MDTGNKIALGVILGGLSLAAGGLAYAVWRKDSALGNTETVHEGGMTLKYTHKKNIPIKKRIAMIQDLVFKGVKDPEMRKLALQITSSCPERDGMCEAKAVYDYTKANVRYSGDVGVIKHGSKGPIEGIDLFQSPKRTIEIGSGDCDCQAALNATLLALNGISPILRVTSTARFGGDDSWGHIYALARLPKEHPSKTVGIDTTLPGDDWFDKEVPFARKLDFPA